MCCSEFSKYHELNNYWPVLPCVLQVAMRVGTWASGVANVLQGALQTEFVKFKPHHIFSTSCDKCVPRTQHHELNESSKDHELNVICGKEP